MLNAFQINQEAYTLSAFSIMSVSVSEFYQSILQFSSTNLRL